MTAPAGNPTNAVYHDTLYRGLLRHAFFRLTFLYFIPLLLLTLFFHLQYRLVVRDAEQRHRESLAYHQAAMLEMYLGDRLLDQHHHAERKDGEAHQQKQRQQC